MKTVSKILMMVSLIAFLVAILYLFDLFIDRSTFYILLLIGGLALVFAECFQEKQRNYYKSYIGDV
ncbi:hypothetical protein CF394_08580 [Tetzosporium hominis]|uniref:Uncharacterized protein n=1 Tax=Tetzosporium hominis TaxID=2020506 RepID=A0A264W2I9_9BACL|nr:hypothetical protein [Tetzosporium hominis]OZS77800.1 hypothetical protein CF394_08580 [Tetzosporium hominis]